MWRLSRLQNLAISPLATILLCENQPPSEQHWGMTEHPENGTGSHCGNCRNRLFTALRLWHWREPADKLTARSQLTAHRSRHLPAGEEILNEGKTYTCQTHTHSQATRCRQEPSVKVGGMRLLLFITIPKPELTFRVLLERYLVPERKSREVAKFKTGVGISHYGMTKIWIMILHYVNYKLMKSLYKRDFV